MVFSNKEGEQDDQDTDIEAVEEPDKVAQALAAANALGNSSRSITLTNSDAIADGLQELDMDNYDEEDDGIELFSKGLGDTYYPDNSEDPYLKDKDGNDSEELEDIIIKAEDSVILCAHNEEDDGHLEMWILEDIDDDKNMFIHHDILLHGFLLCTAWLDCPIKGGEKGNFIAVGSMEPAIEIWDLDIMDEVQPSQILGGVDERNKKIKNKGTKESMKYKKGSHTDSVLGLAWNKEYRNILASASADNSVKIWDVATGECNITMEHHTDKVQSVAWNHHAPQVLLSGSFDHSVVMKDGRIPEHTGFKWSVDADVESLTWNPHNEYSFVVSLENGTVTGFDIRAPKTDASSGPKPSFIIHAHDKAVSSISYNPLIPNLLATGSTDTLVIPCRKLEFLSCFRTPAVKLWDLSYDKPSCIASKNPKAGAVFSIAFSEDSPFLMAIGGSKGKLKVWDTITDAGVSRKYGKYIDQ